MSTSERERQQLPTAETTGQARQSVRESGEMSRRRSRAGRGAAAGRPAEFGGGSAPPPRESRAQRDAMVRWRRTEARQSESEREESRRRTLPGRSAGHHGHELCGGRRHARSAHTGGTVTASLSAGLSRRPDCTAPPQTAGR